MVVAERSGVGLLCTSHRRELAVYVVYSCRRSNFLVGPVRLVAALALALMLGCSDDPPPLPAQADRASSDPVVEEYLEQVAPVLLAKCGDCHHSEVEAPWYAAVPFAGDLVKRDIEWGRQRLDLSLPVPFVAGRDVGPRSYLIALRTALLDDTMPPLAYLLSHPMGTLSDDERGRVVRWVERALAAISAREETEEEGTYEHVIALIRNRCVRCHRDGVALDMNGEFVDVADLEFLVEDGEYIDPDDIDASKLFERVSSEEEPMPPSPNDRLSAEDLASLRRWIEDGAEVP